MHLGLLAWDFAVVCGHVRPCHRQACQNSRPRPASSRLPVLLYKRAQLLKKAGLDSSSPANYRPISNLSTMSKNTTHDWCWHVYEASSVRLIHKQLQPVYQSAYRTGHSTEAALGLLEVFDGHRWSLVFRFGGLKHGERGARTYNGGLGAVPPAGSSGKAPGGGLGGRSPLKLKTFRVFEFERSYILTTNLLSLPLLWHVKLD